MLSLFDSDPKNVIPILLTALKILTNKTVEVEKILFLEKPSAVFLTFINPYLTDPCSFTSAWLVLNKSIWSTTVSAFRKLICHRGSCIKPGQCKRQSLQAFSATISRHQTETEKAICGLGSLRRHWEPLGGKAEASHCTECFGVALCFALWHSNDLY